MPEPEMRHIKRKTEQTGVNRKGLYYLFVIAVDDYSKGGQRKVVDDKIVQSPVFEKLSNPVIDAARLVNVLVSKYDFDVEGGAGRKLEGYPLEVIEYNTIRTTCLYNENAKARNIIAHLHKLEAVLKADDYLLIFFAGHGDNNPINPSGYFIPFDGINDQNEVNTWVPFSYLYNLFQFPKCRDLLMILDSCYAGSARLGAAIQQAASFSRKTLVSTSVTEPAVDGAAGKGSPFAKALAYILETNTFGLATLDIGALRKRFEHEYQSMYEQEPAQKIIYDSLPVACGEGEFIFELKDKDVPPPGLLTQTFIRHLNFSKEKTLLEDKLDSFSDADLNLIITREPNRHLHELLRAVLFSQLCRYDEQSKCLMKLNLCTRKSLPLDMTPDVWSALVANFGQPAEHSDQLSVVRSILSQLLDKPMIISLHSNSLTKELTTRIVNFCKEFTEQLAKEKQRKLDAGIPEEKYCKLFLVIPDLRNMGEDFFMEEDLTLLLGTHYNLFVNKPTEELIKARSLIWFEEVKAIGSKNIQKLEPDDFFAERNRKYSIMEFIYSVCEKVMVDKLEVENAIINY
jgi:hypothetical protein